MGDALSVARFANLGPSSVEFDPANRACADSFHVAHAKADSTSVALWSLDMDYFISDHACAASPALCDCFRDRSFIRLRQFSCKAWGFTRTCQFLRRVKSLDMGICSYSHRCARRVNVVLP